MAESLVVVGGDNVPLDGVEGEAVLSRASLLASVSGSNLQRINRDVDGTRTRRNGNTQGSKTECYDRSPIILAATVTPPHARLHLLRQLGTRT